MSEAVIHIPNEAEAWLHVDYWSRMDEIAVVFDCPHTTPTLVEDGPYVVRSQDIRGRTFEKSTAGRVSEATYLERIARAVPQYGDLLYSREGTYFGISAPVPRGEKVCLGQRMTLLRPEPSKVDHIFLNYWLNSDLMERFLAGFRDGSVAQRLNMSTIRGLPVPVFPVDEQRKIARTLQVLDDKIELNRRMSATLEEMARALYRSWFVDFDPVHARALGQSPAHMDPTTAALFPDSFGPEGLPKGWATCSVEDIFEVVMGQSPPGNTYNDDEEGLPFFQGRTDFGFRYPENRKFCSAPSRVAEPESVLLSVRAPVGDLNRSWERCCIGRGVASLAEKEARTSFGYYAMWSLSAELLSYDSEGTVFGAINKKQLLGLSTIAVPSELRDIFEEVVGPIDSRIRNLTAESRTLATLRDTVLPRLMSGELRIREAEKQIEEVV